MFVGIYFCLFIKKPGVTCNVSGDNSINVIFSCRALSGFPASTVPLTFSFTRYSNDIRTKIDRYTNVIPYTYDSDIQYDMVLGQSVCERLYFFVMFTCQITVTSSTNPLCGHLFE